MTETIAFIGWAGARLLGVRHAGGVGTVELERLAAFCEVMPGQFEVWRVPAVIVVDGLDGLDADNVDDDAELTDGHVLDPYGMEIALTELRDAQPITEVRLRFKDGATIVLRGGRAVLQIGGTAERQADAFYPID